MAQGSVAPEGKYGGFSSGSKLEGIILGALTSIAIIGSLALGYLSIKKNFQKELLNTVEVNYILNTNQHIDGEIQGYYPGK